MFEGGNKQQVSGPKPSWKKSGNAPKSPPPVISNDNPVAGRQTSWSSGGMSFKIVETSATFN